MKRNPIIDFLAVAGVLAGIAAVQLYFLSTSTATLFAWTVNPSIAAAFIGAHFFAVVVMAIAAVRRSNYQKQHARYFLPTVTVFASVMLAATLLHFDKFHFASPDLTARIAAWAWIIVYVGVPIGGILAMVKEKVWQKNLTTSLSPLPHWVRAGLLSFGVAFTFVGIGSFLYPATFAEFWPWTITPLISRASAAMLIALGVTAFSLVRENSVPVSRAPLNAFLLLAVLHFIALVRFSDQIIQSTALLIYMALLGAMIIFSLAAQMIMGRKK